jgi:hypothetical protein
MSNLSLKIPARYPPRNPRTAVTIEAALFLNGDSSARLVVRNLSREGLMGCTDADLEPGTWIGIELPGIGVVPANVRWCERGEAGLRFRRPLDPERFALALPA